MMHVNEVTPELIENRAEMLFLQSIAHKPSAWLAAPFQDQPQSIRDRYLSSALATFEKSARWRIPGQ